MTDLETVPGEDNPWPADDDIASNGDLDAAVVANIPHNGAHEDEEDAHGIYRKVLAAHLDGVIGDLGNALRRARAAREALGGE